MTKDSVVAEVRAAREAYAAQFGFDLAAIGRDLQEREQAGGRVVLPPPPAVGRAGVGGVLPSQALPQTGAA